MCKYWKPSLDKTNVQATIMSDKLIEEKKIYLFYNW